MINLFRADFFLAKLESGKMSLIKRISQDEVSNAAHALWLDTSEADAITFETLKIINQTYCRKFSFFSGKSSRRLIGGLFYLLGYRYDVIKKQYELADHLGTTEVTIRESYRMWLESFPDLFLDVISKFASNNELRFFVLLDLKQSRLQSENKPLGPLVAS